MYDEASLKKLQKNGKFLGRREKLGMRETREK